eukprot:gnl/TRDRNA2_/TRDRNA2_180204_c0_seq1.p1 gnl/TRDRNA2_/TRDRNA2_180204_c0~~gnl/TRDRNA2_/TRDRNA2_180204_c0_seq1.p1  ORF type:complete len:107 (-),score=7.03 gnl/TRDRNA2_/TRDRNA2_180204_c0_seq1:229-549(-)
MTFTGVPMWNPISMNHSSQISQHSKNRRKSKSRFIAIPPSSNPRSPVNDRKRSQSPKRGTKEAVQDASQMCKTNSEHRDHVADQCGYRAMKFLRVLDGFRPSTSRR